VRRVSPRIIPPNAGRARSHAKKENMSPCFRFLSSGSLILLTVAGGCSAAPSVSVPSAGNFANISQDKGGGGKGHCGSFAPKTGGGTSMMYTAQLYGHDLKVYYNGGSGLLYECSLTQGVKDPNGSMTTPNGWWYVANGSGENVLVYRAKKGLPSGPVSSLSDYNEYATNVATNPSRQVVAVSNYDTVPAGGGGSVAIYLHRQSTSTRTLSYARSGANYGAGVAISRNGDCYWAINGSSANTGTVVKFAGCNGSPTVVASGIPKVGGLALDQAGQLYYVNSLTSSGVLAGIYKCSHSSCGVFSTNSLVAPTNMNFDYRGKHLWVADPGAGYIDEISSKDGSLDYQYATGTSDPPFGIAPEPG
jgi:hypothetical protein